MKESEVAKASELMKTITKELNSSVHMSVEWLILLGEYQGIEILMHEFGYELNGSEFVEVSHD